MSVLIERRREVGEADVEHLNERRADIATTLQRLSDAAAAITGKSCSPATLSKFFDAGNRRGSQESAAVRFWLDHNGFAELPVKYEALRTAFHYDAKVTRLIEAAVNSQGCTKDPERYWQDGKFQPLPVTDAERASIMERAEIRVATEEDAVYYRDIEKIVKLANYQNAKTQHDTVHLLDLTSGGNAVYADFIRVVPAGPHILDRPTLGVNLAAFNPVVSDYRAFDEQ